MSHAAFTLTVVGSAPGYTHFRGHLRVRSRYGLVIRDHPSDGVVDRLQSLGFPPLCYPSYEAPDSCLGRSSLLNVSTFLDAQPVVEILIRLACSRRLYPTSCWWLAKLASRRSSSRSIRRRASSFNAPPR